MVAAYTGNPPPPSPRAGFSTYNPDPAARLERGEEVWIPDIRSSEEEEEEEEQLARPLLRLWTRKRRRWRSCRDAGTSSGSNSSCSGKGRVFHPKTEAPGDAVASSEHHRPANWCNWEGVKNPGGRQQAEVPNASPGRRTLLLLEQD